MCFLYLPLGCYKKQLIHHSYLYPNTQVFMLLLILFLCIDNHLYFSFCQVHTPGIFSSSLAQHLPPFFYFTSTITPFLYQLFCSLIDFYMFWVLWLSITGTPIACFALDTTDQPPLPDAYCSKAQVLCVLIK